MAVEIGTLVLKGRFGPAQPDPQTQPDLAEALDVLRREVLREVDERLDAATRRAWER